MNQGSGPHAAHLNQSLHAEHRVLLVYRRAALVFEDRLSITKVVLLNTDLFPGPAPDSGVFSKDAQLNAFIARWASLHQRFEPRTPVAIILCKDCLSTRCNVA